MTSLEGSICKGELVIYYEHQFLKYNNHTVKKIYIFSNLFVQKNIETLYVYIPKVIFQH